MAALQAERPNGLRFASSLVSAIVGFSMVACTTLKPQILSKELVLGERSREDCAAEAKDYAGNLPASICRVNRLRLDYLEAVSDESTLHNLIGAGLLTLSATSLYKGLTSSGDSTQKLLAKTGLTAGAAYVYGETFISVPKQRIYLAGADALGCAVLATRPFLYKAEDIGPRMVAPDASRTPRTLHEVLARFNQDMARLTQEIASVNANLADRQAEPPVICSTKPASPELGTNAAHSAIFNAGSAAASSKAYQACLKSPEKLAYDNSVLGNRLVISRLGEAKVLLGNAQLAMNKGNELVASIDLAAAQLESRANEIQSQVMLEVTKTQPDLAALFQGGDALRANAAKFSSGKFLELPKDTSGNPPKAEGDAGQASQLSEDVKKDLAGLKTAMEAVQSSGAQLEGWLNRADAMSKMVKDLSTCRFNGAAAQGALLLSPDVDEVSLAEGETFTWIAHGLNDKLRVDPIGANTNTHASTVVVGNQLTVKLDKALASGQVLQFSLSNEKSTLRREVRVVGKSADGSGASPTKGKAESNINVPLTKGDMTTLCNRFGGGSVGSNCAKPDAMSAAFSACKQTINDPGPADWSNQAVVKAMLDGRCVPKP